MFFILGAIVFLLVLVFVFSATRKSVQKREEAEFQRKLAEKKRTEQKRIANLKGELGEYKINFQFERLPGDYKHLADVMIRSTKGLTQIDHIVVSPYGIFVVETKNYAGWIFGNQDNKYWTQTFHNKKAKFYNPIWQNNGHIKALRELLKDYKDLKFHSIIAFTRRCELRQIKSDITVIYDTEISNVILRRNKEIFLSNSDVLNIYNLLKDANITDERVREEHIQQINRTIKNN
ncbi:MAG: nuclease-related domain-containing protein [Peptococcaceae bacterium]